MPWMSVAASIGGSLLSGAISGDSAGDAANTQAQSTDKATAEQKRQFDLSRKDLAPFRDAGSAAVNRLSNMLGLSGGPTARKTREEIYAEILGGYDADHREKYGIGIQESPDAAGLAAQLGTINRMADEQFNAQTSEGTPAEPEHAALNKRFTLADFWDDPVTKASFQFGLDNGTKALGNMAGARGNRNSGAQLKALTKFGTDYTGTKAAESYGRFYGDQDRDFNRLSGIAGTGQTATTAGAMLGQNSANTVSGLMSAQGNARGAAAIAGGNALGGGIQNIGNSLSNWWNRRSNPYALGGVGGPTPYYGNSASWDGEP